MTSPNLQTLCEQGQTLLMAMDYLAAEAALSAAAEQAWNSGDFDTFSRVYLPLQESRRQRRQRAGEGVVRLDLVATGPNDSPDPHRLIEQYPHGQLLIAGWATLAPAMEFRRLQQKRNLYVDTFLAAVYPTNAGNVTVIIPLADVPLPPPQIQPLTSLLSKLPQHTIALRPGELPAGPRPGTPDTYSQVMDLWERLHSPFLAAADATANPRGRIAAYLQTIAVDYACELAHQKLSQTARLLLRPPLPRHQAPPDNPSDVKIDKD
jgi:hypothetical protein